MTTTPILGSTEVQQYERDGFVLVPHITPGGLDEFVDNLFKIDAGDDSILQMVNEWLLDKWDPEWPRSRGFDAADPPYRIQRQMALFRRFLLCGEPYKWPNSSFVDALPMLRLWATGLTVSAVMVTLTISVQHHWVAPLALVCVALATWLRRRRRRGRIPAPRPRSRRAVRRSAALQWRSSFDARGSGGIGRRIGLKIRS